ncbi:SCP-like extracellular [[Leptolyngbya] sp. PCC 7376]|uniref:CAP domain-containing protein n=1 Tax=[Leptolyngbya] sp. PCC 7376 TaxID=111781 RepID=UPI00029F424A|nr:CAP domain-containing protein [[Leptolyngbya] sp. PCC 7376]AFY38308.1 SCP-like extracellular [[Leptolyngbya] sp. PCC 7376]
MTTRTEPLPFDGKPVFVDNDGTWREAGLRGYGYNSATGYQYKVQYKDDGSEEAGVLSARIKTFAEALAEGIVENVYDLTSPTAIAQMVEAHNDWRANYGITETVEWDETIAAYAQEWADHLSANNLRGHRPDCDYVENIAYASGQMLSSAAVVDLWGNEVHDYDYATNTCAPGKVCGHYTQVVWRDSRKIGCGMARTADGKEVWVCNYDPKGNWVGQKPY